VKDSLLSPVGSNSVQKDLYGGSNRLPHFFVRRRRAETKDDLQMKVVADHADKVTSCLQAIIRSDFPRFLASSSA
jgi:hypothetical protein